MANATPQFADLTFVPTQPQTLANEVLPALQAAPGALQVTSWLLNGPYRSIVQAVAFCRTNARLMLAALTAAGFEDYVFGRTPAPGGIDVTGWAPFVAKQRYGVTQKPATYTQRLITLTNSSVSAYSNLQPGSSIILQFPSGNRWFLNQVLTIPAAVAGVPSVVQAVFRSELVMASGLSYNSDAPNSSIAFVTSSYPGVTATNPSTTYGPVTQSGSGGGTVTAGGSPSGTHNVTVQITQTGTVAGATVGWQTSLDGAAFVVQSGSVATNIGGTGINVTLADAGNNFVGGNFYYFVTPGSDITQVGAVIETPQALGQRCAGLWPLLAFTLDANGNFVPPASPTQSAYIALAISANANVVGAFVAAGQINNVINLVVFGQGGAPLPAAVITSEQSFFQSFNMLTDQVQVSQATQRVITLALSAGAITVRAAQAASAKAEMLRRLQVYFGGTDTAQPLSVNGLIDYDYVLSLMRTTPGVLHVPTGALTINGATSDLQLPVTPGAFEVAYWTQSITAAFSFLSQ